MKSKAPLSLFNTGEFTLHSGQKSSFKIDCAALLGPDWKALAALIASRVGPFRCVYGIPRGGMALAEQLRPLQSDDKQDPVLLVDDVYTTGASMREARDWFLENENVVGVVVFARRPVQEPWITALFMMDFAG